MKSSDIDIRAISQEMPQPSITEIRLKITYLKYSNFPGANELTTVLCQVEADEDALAELILRDTLDETIQEIDRLDFDDADVHYEARRMLDAPSLETMLQRLQEMEVSGTEQGNLCCWEIEGQFNMKILFYHYLASIWDHLTFTMGIPVLVIGPLCISVMQVNVRQGPFH